MKRILYILIGLFGCVLLSTAQNYYFVTLHDKANSPFSLSQPQAFLSERAIARRIKHNCPIDSMDLPINAEYVNLIKATGASVIHASKWFNGVTVLATNEQYDAIRGLSCVDSVELTWAPLSPVRGIRKNRVVSTTLSYPNSQVQHQMLNLSVLHNAGFRGQELQIAVLDDGFEHVNTMSAFDSLRLQGRLLGTRDFVNPSGSVFNQGTHGTAVLSTMAANVPNKFLGTAPEASYWLFRTEDDDPESRLEIDNWVAALEVADSLGVDIVNSSLGYTEFDDSSQNFTYADLNGRTARNSLAATWAARRGMLLCISAGNEGELSWRYISTPADADSILCVGAVKADETFSPFSSVGPSSDGRVKPEVCAMGSAAAVVNSDNVVTVSNGTSFSSPIMAGAVACLWQALPLKTNMELLQLVLGASDRYTSPDYQYGYGIPDLGSVYMSVVGNQSVISADVRPICYPNPVETTLYISTANAIQWQLFDVQGCMQTSGNSCNIDFSTFPQGIYYLKLNQLDNVFIYKIIHK